MRPSAACSASPRRRGHGSIDRAAPSRAARRRRRPSLGGGHVPRADRMGAVAGELDPRRASRAAIGGRADAGPMFLRPRAGCERSSTRSSPTRRSGRTQAEVIRADDRRIELATGAEPCDAVVLAGGSTAAASVLGDRAPLDLRAMRAVSTGVVFLVYPSGTAAALPDGSGAVVPRGRAPRSPRPRSSRGSGPTTASATAPPILRC